MILQGKSAKSPLSWINPAEGTLMSKTWISSIFFAVKFIVGDSMLKKAILVILILTSLFLAMFISYSKNGIQPTFVSATDQSELCNDVLIMLLRPTIQQGVDDYYKRYLTETPGVGSDSVKISDIRKSSDGGYDITVNVLPYYGPHNSVGKDQMLLYVTENS
ncbi:DUF3888 domain-containing protein [Faecalispora jeddahensis]|uniref:DUF3888 domain-containing protein n=1 Tax=Faecalispora jeddahensis TaxID=1414721 RepID=UPI001A9BF425|nr:DUF3888 domain-containing protein [Faecalispora jeddahensis]